MKICIVNNFPPYSGVGRVTYKFWRDVNDLPNISAELYCTHAMTKEEFGYEENEGVKFLHPFPYLGHEYLSRFYIYVLDRFKLPTKYDIYHFSNHMLGFMISTKRKCVITLFDVIQLENHGDQDLANGIVNKIYNFLIRQSVKKCARADAIICVSEFTKRRAVKLLGLDSQKTFVAHTGIDLAVFKQQDKRAAREELNLPIDKKIILHVGSEIKRKNVEAIIYALAECTPDTVLLRVGPQDTRIAQLITKLGVHDKVIYRESFYETEVAKYYSAADVMVFPSLAEGFGLPIIEAMACGCPVITSNYGAMQEVAGDAAILVGPQNTEELHSAIQKVLSYTPNEQAAHVNKGLERAKFFTSQKYARSVADIYKKILSATE